MASSPVSDKTQPLPLSDVARPSSQRELVDAVRASYESRTAVYPLGGETSLDYGLPASRPGLGLSLKRLNQVIDYPARDMTITVEAGITMNQLAAALAGQRQQLPVDVPQAEQATLGGVVATNFNGPRRYGRGPLRDYVIGISAVDGRGRLFRGGGRVVKNVAGYDFCKLLTGSLGTLGVITQLTLRLRPLAERFALLACHCRDLDEAEQRLAALVQSATAPAAIELVAGPAWDAMELFSGLGETSGDGAVLLVALEGTDAEVRWMDGQLADEWRAQGASRVERWEDEAAAAVWRRLIEFPAAGDAALVVKASVVPSGTTRWIAELRAVEPRASVQAHAGNGIIVARFPEFPADGLSRTLVARLQPAAIRAGGSMVVLSNPSGAEMTRQVAWDGTDVPFELTSAVKRQFDPHNVLNPGRFVDR